MQKVMDGFEYMMLKTFNAQLTDHERVLIKSYQASMPSPRDDRERRRNNLMCMAMIEGYRIGIKEKGTTNATE